MTLVLLDVRRLVQVRILIELVPLIVWRHVGAQTVNYWMVPTVLNQMIVGAGILTFIYW